LIRALEARKVEAIATVNRIIGAITLCEEMGGAAEPAPVEVSEPAPDPDHQEN